MLIHPASLKTPNPSGMPQQQIPPQFGKQESVCGGRIPPTPVFAGAECRNCGQENIFLEEKDEKIEV